MEQNATPPTPNFDLPTPYGSGEAIPSERPTQGAESHEQKPVASAGPVNPLLNVVPAALPSVPPPVATPPTQGQAASSSAPRVADDGDLIEKAWVEKAKQIVAHTKEDPYRQSSTINQFKAEYIKKRYNKDIVVENT